MNFLLRFHRDGTKYSLNKNTKTEYLKDESGRCLKINWSLRRTRQPEKLFSTVIIMCRCISTLAW